MSISLAIQFIDRHIETYQEGGFWHTEFKGGACHDIDEMDNVTEKFAIQAGRRRSRYLGLHRWQHPAL